MKTIDTKLLIDELGKNILREVVVEDNCPKCQGTLLGLKVTSVVECHDCRKVFQRMSDQDDTYYLELIRVH